MRPTTLCWSVIAITGGLFSLFAASSSFFVRLEEFLMILSGQHGCLSAYLSLCISKPSGSDGRTSREKAKEIQDMLKFSVRIKIPNTNELSSTKTHANAFNTIKTTSRFLTTAIKADETHRLSKMDTNKHLLQISSL